LSPKALKRGERKEKGEKSMKALRGESRRGCRSNLTPEKSQRTGSPDLVTSGGMGTKGKRRFERKKE